MEPIWKDYIAELADPAPSSGFAYALYHSGGPGDNRYIFTGKAYARPGQTVLGVRINDAVAPILQRGFTPAGESDFPWVEIEVEDGEANVLDTPSFRADWSYDPNFVPATHGLNHPVLDTLLPGQLVPLTKPTAGDYTAVITEVSGIVLYDPDFNRDFNADYNNATTHGEDVTIADDFGTGWLDLRDYPGAIQVQIGGRTYRVGGGCDQFALYYVNAYGGWDTLPVRAKVSEQDALTRHNLQTDYNNATSQRGTHTVAIELAHKYTLRTGYMDEASSLKMHHILNSPHVWLHDVIANRFYPVTLTNTATEYKKGGRLYRYDIEAQLAQERIRR